METRPEASLTSTEPTEYRDPAEVFWKALVRCNPFYLFSAVLLLYGVYRASVDPAFLKDETSQVIFNFGSLQVYGLMLVGTVVFLARKGINYDAIVLYFIDNILLLVPFILLSQAVFLESSLARNLSLIGCVLVAVKFGVFKRFFEGLNLPKRLLLVGSLIVIVNSAVPLVFRRGLNVDNELWNPRSQYCWFLLLPLLAMAGHVLNPLRPTTKPGHGDDLTVEEHRKEWIPIATFLLWITGTAAHLYSVGYVDDQKFEVAKFSVLAWAVAWLLCAKITLALSRFTPGAPVVMLSIPVLTPLLALNRPEIAVTLNVLNAAIYGFLCFRWKAVRVPAVLGGVSLLAAVLFVPNHWVTPMIEDYSKGSLIFTLITAAVILQAIRTRTARWALVASLALGFFVLTAAFKLHFSPHFAVQIACVFLLVHSLFWTGTQERGANVLLILAGTALVLDSYALTGERSLALRLVPLMLGAPLLALGLVFRRSVIPIAAAGLSMLLWPLTFGAEALRTTPVGVLALGGSFVLFMVGTGFAIWKRRFPDHGAIGTKETSI
ncbi:MAG TPA: hypothetical protein VF773_04670 [Verrucomicrobiae bacterium]